MATAVSTAVVSQPVQGLQPGLGNPVSLRPLTAPGIAEGCSPPVVRSWAAVLGRSVMKSNDMNVLEVVLQKDTKGSFIVSESDCANLIRRIGLDTRPNVHVVGVQICPNGKGVIYLTLKENVDPCKFIRYDVIDVTDTGIRAVQVKPAGKTDVIVNVKGLHPNTKEDTVISYLNMFGKLASNKVVYGTFSEGPLQGMKNGDRSYKVELNPKVCLGSYHILDGQKVVIKYPGQQQTCGRCLQPSIACKGRGVAKRCEVEGGPKADFIEYIQKMWTDLGYSPDIENTEAINPIRQDETSYFTPAKTNTSPEKFTGVLIKNLPKNADHGEIVEKLVELGLPEKYREKVDISEFGNVSIRDIENRVCLKLIDAIHMKIHFSRKLFCNGIIPLTPEKHTISEKNRSDLSPNLALSVENQTLSVQSKPTVILDSSSSEKLDPSVHIQPSDASEIISNNSETDWPSVPTLVRRHSLSLMNRQPWRGSLAEDLLNVHYSKPIGQNEMLRKSIKDLTDSVSEFNSCQSTNESSSDETKVEVASGARKKRGRKRSPKSNVLSKRVNTNTSPKQ